MTLKRNLISNYLGQGWVAAMSFAFIPVYVGSLGIEAYALIGFYAVLQGWLALLDFGMTPTMTREMARASAGARTAESIGDLLRSIEVVCFSLAITAAALLWLSADWLSVRWFSTQSLTRDSIARAIGVMAFVVAFRFCESIYRGVLFGMERQVWYNSVYALLSTVRYVGAAIIVIWINPTVEAFFWWQAVCSLLIVAILAAASHHWMPLAGRVSRFSPAALRSVTTFAGGLSLTTLSGLLLTHFDKLMLSRVLSLDAFGHYMLAVAITGLFSTLVLPIVSAFYPALTREVAAGDQAAVIRRYRIAAQLSALFLMPAVAVCTIMPQSLLFAWTGNLVLAADVGPLLRLLSVGVAFNSLLQVPFALQLAYGWTSLGLKVNLVAAALLVPVEYFAAQHFGPIGAAATWATVNAALLPTVIVLMHRRLLNTERREWFSTAFLLPLMCSGGFAYAMSLLLPAARSRVEAVGGVVIVGIGCFAVLAICLPACRRILIQETDMRLKRIFA